MKILANRTLSILVLVCFFFASTPIPRVFAEELSSPPEPQTEPSEPESSGEESQEISALSNEPENEPNESTETDTDLDVESENTVEVINEIEDTSETGNNTVLADGEEGEGGNAYIETGDSLAAVNIVNILNSNIIDSDGLILFLQNLLGSNQGSIDLRDYAYLFEDGEVPVGCGELVCGPGSGNITINNSNDVSIINTVEVHAGTGGNEANGNEATILTGDAYASANILNIANTNIVNSNYLILSFDSFGDYAGDIVLPSQSALERFFQMGSAFLSNALSVGNNNSAAVMNNVDTSANTGDNSAVGSDATIVTGDATASTNIFNQLNTNLFNTGNFSVVFRVHGNWLGDIFSLPEGVSYQENGPGMFFLNSSGFGNLPVDSLVTDSVTIHNSNNAYIQNNLIVTAVTGGNNAIGEDGAYILTGDAYASANVTNIANTNIVGKNWILAIINIFGDFTGNVSFGKPDLWVGERVETSGNVKNGSLLDYIYTITNNGDTTATGVKLVDSFDPKLVSFLGSKNGASVNGGKITWDIGSLAPGETIEVGYQGKVQNAPYGETEIVNSVKVSAHEPDENNSDNSDSASVLVYNQPPQRQTQLLNPQTLASLSGDVTDIQIERSNNAANPAVTGDEVTYTLLLKNIGSESIHNTVLTDELRDPSGTVIHTELYSLGEVFPGEEITIEYTVLYGEAFGTGIYVSSAVVSGMDAEGTARLGEPVLDQIHFIQVVVEPVPVVSDPGPSFSLPALIPTAEAAGPADDGSVISNQAAALGLLGTDINNYLLLILILLLAYEATRRYRERR